MKRSAKMFLVLLFCIFTAAFGQSSHQDISTCHNDQVTRGDLKAVIRALQTTENNAPNLIKSCFTTKILDLGLSCFESKSQRGVKNFIIFI